MAFKKFSIENLDEEYYQISSEVLESFPKYRLPLDLFIFKEDVAQIYIYYKKEERLSNEKREELEILTADGVIFVSRSDHSIYAKHISKQLDLILMDSNLKDGEIAEIFQNALHDRLHDFFEQPLKSVYDRLYSDIMVLTEYLFSDPHRIKTINRFLFTEHTLAKHSVNTGFVGLRLYLGFQEGTLNRKALDRVTIGLFLHDIGMSKIPPFIRQKAKPLTPDEWEKVRQHPNIGARLLRNLEIMDEEIIDCALMHHERLDGSGYPRSLKDSSSPLVRICCIADSFSAMICKRHHAEAMTTQKAASTLLDDRNRYDSDICRSLYTFYVMA